MKKIISFLTLLASFFVSGDVKESYAQYVNKSYIVMNATNAEVVEGKNINLVRSVASVSKIMTAIVAIENSDLNKEITIEKEDINTYGSSIYLQEGDQISLLDLVYGLMLRSGNDASKAIARSVGGSVDSFIKMMNDTAKRLGMKNSVFNNPSGLDVDEIGNLSTSYDLALLMSYAIKNETFLEISGTKEYKSYKGIWSNKNKLLRNYKNTIAGKTGFTYKAKRTLVTAARSDDTTFVVVTLDCGNDFNFHKFLYEKNFNKYSSYLILQKGDNFFDEYVVNCNDNIYVTLEKEKLDDYKILNKINKEKASVYLLENDVKKEVGKCNIKRVDNNKNKLSFIDRIRKMFD